MGVFADLTEACSHSIKVFRVFCPLDGAVVCSLAIFVSINVVSTKGANARCPSRGAWVHASPISLPLDDTLSKKEKQKNVMICLYNRFQCRLRNYHQSWTSMDLFLLPLSSTTTTLISYGERYHPQSHSKVAAQFNIIEREIYLVRCQTRRDSSKEEETTAPQICQVERCPSLLCQYFNEKESIKKEREGDDKSSVGQWRRNLYFNQ